MKENVIAFDFYNGGSSDVVFIVEPWADEFNVPAKSKAELYIMFTSLGKIETSISDGFFTIWLWEGCHAKLLIDGEDQPGSFSIPAPNISQE
ncbi:MAG: hypothetical protein E5V36_00925 [Mesorhizobium sp.]|nr:MAG: hypothetical protein E5V36_00925 [Mesorhizobium sp.]